MTIRTEAELKSLQAAGRVVARVLDAMQAEVRPGVSTAELDAVAARTMDHFGARSAPQLVYQFPGSTCISVNDEVVHGVPNASPLRLGDVVKLDVTVELGGFMADAARTVVVGDVESEGRRLARCAEAAFQRGLAAARPGERVKEIGRNVDQEVRQRGFTIIRELAGHGIGRTIHEAPTVPNFNDRRARTRLQAGMVLTIEPILSAGADSVYLASDGWTVRTSDRALAAHFEHTIVITEGEPILLTAA